jgi:general secretion pathway protein B
VAEAKRTRAPASEETATAGVAAPTAAEPAEASPASAVSESYESFSDLQARGILSLPELHLDIHVFSGEPADRFVFINMTKYRENAKLSEGPVVKQITAEGVVLGYQGTDFLLPRE